jgi:hypothetical protein
MSQSIVWSIPNEIVEAAFRAKMKLDEPVTAWASGFDEVGLNVFIVFDVDECDIDKLMVDGLDCHVLEEGEQVQ